MDDVTIGADAILLPGIRIGHGPFVGVGAVVTKDVSPWSLIVGDPDASAGFPNDWYEENRARRW